MKNISPANIFNHVNAVPDDEELFETLASGDVVIERIVSRGQITPEAEWYNQEKDEWVILLTGEARILFENSGEIALKPGDYLLIPARERHRVTYTSKSPECIWLAIHGHIHDKK